MLFYIILTIVFIRLYFKIKDKDTKTKFTPLLAAFLTLSGAIFSLVSVLQKKPSTYYDKYMIIIAAVVLILIVILELTEKKREKPIEIYTEVDKKREEILNDVSKSVIEFKKENPDYSFSFKDEEDD